MKTLLSTLAVLAALVLTTPGIPGQSPAAASADPGLVLPHAPTGLTVPVGWEANSLISLASALTTPASVVVGANGDLFFTESVGASCSASSTTHVWRLAMNGNVPAPGAVPVQYTTSPIDAQALTYDPVTSDLYAAGTCDQTSNVYRIPLTGIPEILNPAIPLNDPDGLALGNLPGLTSAQLFITAQDGLFAMDLGSGPIPTVTPIAVDLSTTGAANLGNWGFPIWDDNTQTLLATNAGRPTTRKTIEITFTSATTATAQVIGPDNVPPLGIDQQGVRWWRDESDLGLVNDSFGTPVFTPCVGNLGVASVATPFGNGSFFVIDTANAQLHRLDRPFTASQLEVSTSQGAFVTLSLNAPPGRVSEGYMVLASASGASPGTPYGPTLAPINQDLVTQIAFQLALANDPLTNNWVGFVDSFGQATAGFLFHPGVVPSGVTINLCFILGNPEYASNTAWIHVLP
ncbi:MAG: hypothetical protein CMJ83_10020 [Planctomycetes bacterium]|nr:hypothetical protein [Planctomycetota bacterium]